MHALTTERLLLRRWQTSDREPFAQLTSDPEVMRYFAAPLTRAASDDLADRADAAIARQGWGMWALEERATARFIGFTGLGHVPFEAPFTPAVEIDGTSCTGSQLLAGSSDRNGPL